jgi:hypothetical protein
MLHLDFRVWASDWVQSIEVNGQIAYDSKIVPPNFAWNRITPVSFSWCKFKPGQQNEIIIRVATYPWNTNTVTPTTCYTAGMKIECWGPSSNYKAITGNSLVCAGTTNTYSTPHYTTYGLPPNSATYTWTKPWTPGASTTNTLATVAGTNSGVISYITYSSNPNFTHYCLYTGSFSVTVPPPITITPTGTSVCQGNSITLTASGAANYTWYAGGAVIATTNTVSVIPTAPATTYSVKGITVNGCVYSKTVSIAVLPKPNTFIVPSTTVICSGQPVTLQVYGSAVSYSWANQPTSSTSTIITRFPATTTIFSVTGTGQNGCKRLAVQTVSVNPSPIVTAVANLSVICVGDISTLTASGANTYTWNPGNQVGNPIQVSPGATTIYSVTGTSANACTGTVTTTVTVLQPPVVSINPPFICPNMANTIIATGASTYTWYIGSPATNTIPNTSVIIVTPAAATVYSVCGMGGQNGCVACTAVTLSPGGPIPITVNDVTLCTNGGPCATIVASSTLAAPVNYTWMPGALTGTSAVVCPTVSEVYTVSATSPSGCPSSATLAVTVQTNCCPQPTTGVTVLTALSGTYASGSYIISSTVTASGLSMFQNSEILMTPAAKIIVPDSASFLLHNMHLFACGIKMWEGIEVQDGGLVGTYITAPGQNITTLIEDAVTAINVTGVTTTYTTVPVIIRQVIFNKNLVGIRINGNDNLLTNVPLEINGCLFTSHDMTFTTLSTPLSWPSADLTGAGLRVATNPTTGLAPPYILNGFPHTTLKQPYQNFHGEAGIVIQNIGDIGNPFPTPGVEFGITYPGWFATNDFNLFDGLSFGIDITDASFTSINNVFQNMKPNTNAIIPYGGIGIRHTVNQIMNAGLYLQGVKGTDIGTQFWECIRGISANNVYDLQVSNGIFRSMQSSPNAWFPLLLPGEFGIKSETNRFKVGISDCEFNNLKDGIRLETPTVTTSYDMNGFGSFAGIYADEINITQNYFGPQVLSSTPNSLEYLSNAISLVTPLTAGWVNSGSQSYIESNRMDRVLRGVYVNGMEDHPLAVQGNSIYVEDDLVYGTAASPWFGYGVAAEGNMGNLSVSSNTLEGLNSQPPNNVSLVYMYNNTNSGGPPSPKVFCNKTRNSHYGFHFEDDNSATRWEGNIMCQHWAGLALTNNGKIGQQGTPGAASDNQWEFAPPMCSPWTGNAPANNETYVENSDPTLSPLYVFMPGPPFEPINNISNAPSVSPYSFGQSIYTAMNHNLTNMDCFTTTYPPVPSWRTAPPTAINSEKIQGTSIRLIPNPTSGLLTIEGADDSSIINIRVLDLSGRVIAEHMMNGIESLDVSDLAAGIYVVDLTIQGSSTQRQRTKLIKTN